MFAELKNGREGAMERLERQQNGERVDVFDRLVKERLHDLPPDQIAEFKQVARIKEYEPGTVLIGEDERPDIIGGVIAGVLREQKNTRDGKAHIVDFRFPGNSFGHLDDTPSNVSVEVATDAVVWIADRRTFARLADRYRVFFDLFFGSALQDLDLARRQILLLASGDLNQKLAWFLLQFLETGSENQTNCIRLPVSRKDIADYLGTTLESISRFMAGLEANGVIEFKKRDAILVHDLESLKNLAGEVSDAGSKKGG
jgi:CRP/FNR family transcriptional regulator